MQLPKIQGGFAGGPAFTTALGAHHYRLLALEMVSSYSENNIIELGGNYYILKVEEKHGGDAPSLEKIRPEIEKRLLQEEAQRQQELWLATLRQKAYIRTF